MTTRRKDFAGRRTALLAAIAGARQGMSETDDPASLAVRQAACKVLDDVEKQIRDPKGLNPRTLPGCAEKSLYSPLRQFFHSDLPDQLVQQISRAQVDGLGTLADAFYYAYGRPQSLKRTREVALTGACGTAVDDQCRRDIVNIAEYLQHIFDVCTAAAPVRRSTRGSRVGVGLGALRTEQRRSAEVYCRLCQHRPSQQHQALTKTAAGVAILVLAAAALIR